MFPQIFGKYVLERELAAGGMAKVFLATLRGAVGFEKRLVVKQIRTELASDPAFVRRFVEEAKTAVELSHANIVPVYELGVEHGVYYIAMELCAGLTLSEVLADSGKLSPEEGAYLGSEICRALDYAHRRAGIVHRDVTPRNVLIDEEGAVRLIDFGIAAPVTAEGGQRSEVFGSPGHMPPEQLAGGPLTPAADVFAVATLLVEVWSGRAPFRRNSAQESERALAEPVPRVDEVDSALAPLADHVASATALDPRERPQQAELFARPLRDFLRHVDSVDVARRVGERVQRAQRRARKRETGTSSGPVTPVAEQPRLPLTPGAPTRTFAARDEVIEWTRRLDPSAREGEALPDSSTRKLVSPLPRMTATGAVVAGEHAESPPAVELGMPHEVPGQIPARALVSSRGARLRSLGAALLLAIVLAGAFELARPGSRDPARAASSVTAAPHEPAPPAAASARVALVVRSAAASVSSAPRGPASIPASEAVAKLRLTADPPARVSVRGTGVARAFETPVRELKLPAGSYSVTFESAIYGVPLVTRVVLTGGAQRSVHADFREAEPRVTVR